MKRFLNTFFALLAVSLFSIAVSASTGLPVLAVGGTITGVSLMTPAVQGSLFAGLNKEIWLPDLMEGFYGDDMFLKEARDMSAFVENDVIHLAEAGVNPNVLINNSTYPIPVAQRNDTPISLTLDTYDTENTLIRNIEIAELSYDKRTSVLYGHRMSLRMKYMEKAIHAFAPSSNGNYTPVLQTSGADDGTGHKMLTFQDILDLETAFDDAEVGAEGRILVLSTKHKNHLRKQDLTLYKTIFSNESTYGGFKIYTLATKRMPVYNKATGVKVAYGAAPAPTTDTICSVAFQKNEVMRCQGTVDMFAKLKDPEERGDVYGFQMRGLAMPIRNKGIGAVYSVVV